MTPEQLSTIAKITLENTKLLSGVVTTCYSLLEEVLPLLPERERAISLLSDIEQLQACAVALRRSVESAEHDLGFS